MKKRVYSITWQGYKYTVVPGVDWLLGPEETKLIAAPNALAAIKWLRDQTTHQIEIQKFHTVCEIDHVVEE